MEAKKSLQVYRCPNCWKYFQREIHGEKVNDTVAKRGPAKELTCLDCHGDEIMAEMDDLDGDFRLGPDAASSE